MELVFIYFICEFIFLLPYCDRSTCTSENTVPRCLSALCSISRFFSLLSLLQAMSNWILKVSILLILSYDCAEQQETM